MIPYLPVGHTLCLVQCGTESNKDIGTFLQAVTVSIEVNEIERKIPAIDKVQSTHHTYFWSLDRAHHVLRNLSQAQGLDVELNEIIRPIQHVFVIELADEDVIARITGRRMDPESGGIYHMRFNPPPDEIKSRLIQRSDDTEETVKKRLAEYYNETLPIIHYSFLCEKGNTT